MYFLIILFLLINSIKSCPLTDNYLSRCHCGILTNGESYIKCDEQSLNEIPTFKRSFPYDELILSNNNIKNLTRSSFDNIKTIRRINLENNLIEFIDNDLLRLLGNYLEELILTGDNHINSLEFLTRYPLKKLRVLKLNQFNLSELNLEKIFFNMTNLEIVYLRSCQIKQLPNLLNIQILDLKNNEISNSISLSTSYIHLNLAKNFISSIILENNWKLNSLNLSKNFIKEIQFSIQSLSLLSLDLSYNQLKIIEKNFLFEKLNYLNLEHNPLECNCHLEWLKKLILYQKSINTSTWTCNSNKSFISSNFQCLIPRILIFNISYIKISSENGFFIQWSIIDEDKILNYIQISISDPFYLSPKISSNQTEVFLSNSIQLNKQYNICLILLHKYARDKYCREYLINSIELNQQFDLNLYLMLIGTCIGGLITILLIFTCCYLCFKIHKYNFKKTNKKNQNFNYPIYHSSICPYHHENLSNSTDSSQIDTSLSTTNFKHIYQTIDNQYYSSLKRDTQLFHLWNQSLRQKR